eukprot:comp23207_c0_seq1/m.37707 comp23207_c0_seq1/g.37707  ORF comp23207_c0_seq1/g.37707 comp23207_c0_seq1/m.37707 type:complete len:625 (-) comp23207_c0_seq1:531-2405(-)
MPSWDWETPTTVRSVGQQRGWRKKLQTLGAVPFVPSGYADDAVGLEKTIIPWQETLWKVLSALKPGSDAVVPSPIPTPTIQSPPTPASPALRTSTPALETQKLAFYSFLEQQASNLTSDPTDVPRLAAPFLSVDLVPSHPTPAPSPLPPRLENARVSPDTYDMNRPFKSRVMSCKRLTSNDNAVKKTLLVELDLHGSGIDFEPGDAFGMLCENHPREVDLVLSLLGLSDVADMGYTVSVPPTTDKKNAEVPSHVAQSSTFRSLFTKHIDLRSVPRKAFIRMLAEECKDANEKRQLLYLCSRQGASAWNRLIESGSYRLTEIFSHFPSCKPSLARLFESLTPLLPRFYSAASSALSHPHSVQFAFNVVEFEGRDAPFNRGVATGWLDRIGGTAEEAHRVSEGLLPTGTTNQFVWLYPKPTPHFRLPDDPTVPVIMIGPGTGVAPFIGFLHHRMHMRGQQALGSLGPTPSTSQLSAPSNAQLGQPADKQPGDVIKGLESAGKDNFMWLFFGCRHEGKDQLFKEELEGMRREGTLTRLSVAFSRDNKLPGVRYVQDLMRIHGPELAELVMRRNAHIYVCGDAQNMCKDVDKALVDILVAAEGMTETEAESVLKRLFEEHRYKRDVWA